MSRQSSKYDIVSGSIVYRPMRVERVQISSGVCCHRVDFEPASQGEEETEVSVHTPIIYNKWSPNSSIGVKDNEVTELLLHCSLITSTQFERGK